MPDACSAPPWRAIRGGLRRRTTRLCPPEARARLSRRDGSTFPRDGCRFILVQSIAKPRGRIMRTGVSAVKLLCAIAVAVPALVATTAGGPPAAGATAAAPRCSTSGLVVWLDTQGNGAAGSVYYHLKLTNLSARTCTLF